MFCVPICCAFDNVYFSCLLPLFWLDCLLLDLGVLWEPQYESFVLPLASILPPVCPGVLASSQNTCSFVAPFLCQSCLWCRPLKFSLRLLFQDVTSCTHLMGLCVWWGVQIEGFCLLEITNCPHYIMLKRISFLHVINCLYWSKINWPESCIVAMPLLPGLA